MANIPGISGYVQPGVFARDRVISRGVSIPGGLRIVCVLGEGLKEETVVSSAFGSGKDGNITYSPTGTGDGRFFKIANAPVESGRTELRLNQSLLYGTEATVDSTTGKWGASGFDSKYDYRLDVSKGAIEMQKAALADLDGKLYSASSGNTGNGVVAHQGTTWGVDSTNLINILDTNAIAENWTAKCVGTVRDSAGNVISGQSTFTVRGEVTGVVRDANGVPYTWSSNTGSQTGADGAMSGTKDPVADGYLVATNFMAGIGMTSGAVTETSAGSAAKTATSAVGTTTDTIYIAAFDLVKHGQALAGDYIWFNEFSATDYGGYSNPAKIKSITFDSDNDRSVITTEEGALAETQADLIWFIHATNLFVQGDNNGDLHHLTGGSIEVATAPTNSFTSADVGKTLIISSGVNEGRYTITAVTSSRRCRVQKYGDSSSGFPVGLESIYNGMTSAGARYHSDSTASLSDGLRDSSGAYLGMGVSAATILFNSAGAGTHVEMGLSQVSVTYYLLDTNGVLEFAVKEGATPFEVGDFFTLRVQSRVLRNGDELEARYIATEDLNDPEFFTSTSELFKKHGTPSATNTLALGAQMAFENGAPGILALQCKPAISRRTAETLLEAVDSNGDGGIQVSVGTNAERDDLYFPIPRPNSGLGLGKPDTDTEVNIFVVRSGVETQIFPNKYGFYNTQLASGIVNETNTSQVNWISDSDNAYSYTIVSTGVQILGTGFKGVLTGSSTASVANETSTFSTTEFNFDSSHVGDIIVLQSIEVEDTSDGEGTKYTTESAIQTQTGLDDHEMTIHSVLDDNTVVVYGHGTGTADVLTSSFVDVKWFLKNEADTTNTGAALLLHKDLATSGTIKEGDGIRISYIDQKDADLFDTNWFNAFEKLEAQDCQIVVPLPTQNRSKIFRAAVTHCEQMSTIANRKERVALIGAQQGVTVAALLGESEIAVEDIGIIEGIQGDTAAEILAGNVEDLVNFKLSDNYISKRCVYFYPDSIVRNINGTNTNIDGFYIAAAAGGWLSGTQNVAIPLTRKVLTGFALLRDKVYRQIRLNSLGNVGATVLQPVTGGGRVLAGRTTSNTGYVEDEEISVVFIRDRVKQVLRDSLDGYIGTVENENTQGVIGSRVISIMSALVSQGLVTNFENIKVSRDKVDPRQWNVFLRFQPAFPINYIFIDIEVGVL